jgi:hypothetical protein
MLSNTVAVLYETQLRELQHNHNTFLSGRVFDSNNLRITILKVMYVLMHICSVLLYGYLRFCKGAIYTYSAIAKFTVLAL